MASLIEGGRLVPLADLAPDLRARCRARVTAYPDMYSEWIDHALAEAPRGTALVFDSAHAIDGDLVLDGDAAEIKRHDICAMVALAGLRIDGAILNASRDSGPLLFVDGPLEARTIVKGGARLVVLGDVRSAGPVVCDYNHGVVRIAGDLHCAALIALDQDVGVDGTVHGPTIDWDEGNTRELLVPEVFPSEDDDLPDADLIRQRLAAGLAVLQ